MTKVLSPCAQCGAVNRVDLASARDRRPVCSRCKAPLRLYGAVSEVDGAGLEALGRTDRPVVVDFWAEWCGPCKAFAPVFAATATELGDTWTFAKLDTEADPSAAGRFGIQAIPTLIALRGGREIGRRSGALDAGSLRHWLASMS